MPGLIGKKIGMTSVFSADGKNVPCTVIECGPCVVTQIKTIDTDGYEAVQLGFGERKEKTAGKPITGHCKKASTTPKREFVEFQSLGSELKLSDVVTVDILDENGWVDISGVSKGKGFQGVVKRHNFAGVNDATHGQHNRLRAPGSIGAASYPARVFKGMRMGGRMGGDKVTVKNLKVLKVIPEQNLLLVKGSLPGAKGATLIIEQ